MEFKRIFCILALIGILSCATQHPENLKIMKSDNNQQAKKEILSLAENSQDEGLSEKAPYIDMVYDSSLYTVQLYPTNNPLVYPMINLGDPNSQLVLSFDYLGLASRQFYYKIDYCSWDWKSINSSFIEFAEGNEVNYITTFQGSQTLERYINYKAIFPHDNLKILVSGNYVLNVFEEGGKTPVFTKRFKVLDSKLKIEMNSHRATQVNLREYYQEIDFQIDNSGIAITNPFEEIRVCINQNNRTDNEINNLKPLFINGTIMKYDYQEGNLFQGNNEYRYLDIKTLTAVSATINKSGSRYQATLAIEELRSFKKYFYVQDINGAYLIKNDLSAKNSDITAEYVDVEFRLHSSDQRRFGDIYVFGKLSDYLPKEEFKMTYDASKQLYRVKKLLKQGLYNYNYAFLDKEKRVSFIETEGIHSETENEYSIFVYYRPFGTNYDRLVGFQQRKLKL